MVYAYVQCTYMEAKLKILTLSLKSQGYLELFLFCPPDALPLHNGFNIESDDPIEQGFTIARPIFC